MASVSPEELEQVLAIIDKAIQMHVQWHQDLVRTMLCKLPLPDSVAAMDAYRHCAFGTWFYNKANARLHALPTFDRIGELHQIMHESARKMCVKVRATGLVAEHGYDDFVQRLGEFRGGLEEFRGRIRLTFRSVKPESDPG